MTPSELEQLQKKAAETLALRLEKHPVKSNGKPAKRVLLICAGGACISCGEAPVWAGPGKGTGPQQPAGHGPDGADRLHERLRHGADRDRPAGQRALPARQARRRRQDRPAAHAEGRAGEGADVAAEPAGRTGRQPGQDPLLQQAGQDRAGDLRHRRPGEHRGLHRDGGLRGPGQGADLDDPAAGDRRGEGVGHPRPRRRGLPDRHEVADARQRQERREVHHLQRR